MEQFKVGDRVRIKKGTEHYKYDSPSNPRDIDGTITAKRGDYNYKWTVGWDNKNSNGYRDSDLELVEKTEVLPSKWFVRFGSPEQAERVLAYMEKQDKQYRGYQNSGRNRCFNSDNQYWSDVYENNGYTEITFEQFEKHILKENKSTTMATTPQIKKFIIGTRDVEVTVNRLGIIARDVRWPIEELRRTIEHFSRGNNTINGYEVRSANEKLRTIRIGCTDENNIFSLEELRKVYKAYMDCQ